MKQRIAFYLVVVSTLISYIYSQGKLSFLFSFLLPLSINRSIDQYPPTEIQFSIGQQGIT